MRDFPFNFRENHRILIPRSLDGFNSRTYPGIDNMGPVLAGVLREVPPSLDNENTGIADLASPHLLQLEAGGEIGLILGTAGKSRTERFNININLNSIKKFSNILLPA